MKVAVTGANGFVGYHTVHELSQQNFEVKALFGPDTRFNSVLPDLPSIRGDICDEAALRWLVEDAEVVIHLAGPPSVAASFENPAEFVRIHGAGTAELLAASRKAGVRRFIYISSAQVYGIPHTDFVSEDHPLEPRSPYAAAKICGEKLAESYHRSFGLETVILRPFSIYGRGSSPEAVLNRIIDMARSGSSVVLHDLRPILDYCYVGDVARAIVCACRAAVSGAAFNIGSMCPISLEDLARQVIQILNSSAELVENAADRRPGIMGCLRLVADNTKAKRDLAWTPRTTLAEGLRLTLPAPH